MGIRQKVCFVAQDFKGRPGRDENAGGDRQGKDETGIIAQEELPEREMDTVQIFDKRDNPQEEERENDVIRTMAKKLGHYGTVFKGVEEQKHARQERSEKGKYSEPADGCAYFLTLETRVKLSEPARSSAIGGVSRT